ncbi:tetratricopeptide repeat protein [Gemmatimonadota bacterium]
MQKKNEKTWPVEKIAITYLLLVLSGIILAAGFFPDTVWGFGLPAEYQPAVGVCFLALSLVSLVPGLRRKIVRLIQPSISDSATPGISPSRILIFSALAALSAFLFTVPCPIMGDGVQLVYEYVPRPGDDPNINPHSPFLSLFIWVIYKFLFLILGKESALAVQAFELGKLAWSIISALGAFTFVAMLLKVLPELAGDKHNLKVITALVFTTGTMALLSGFVEVAVVLMPVLLFYVLIVLYSLKNRSGPWLFAGTLFFCLGFHASMVAIVPSAAYVAYCKRKQIKVKPFSWLAAFGMTAVVFLILISLLTGLGPFIDLFISGRDSLKLTSVGEAPYSLLSPYHLMDLANVLLLHSPLNLLFAAWIVFVVAVFRDKWSADQKSVFLLLILGGYAGILFIFHPLFGIVSDWDIFAPLGILLPLTAFLLWLVCAPDESKPKISQVAAILLPLAVIHLFLWVNTLHDTEKLLPWLIKKSRQEKFISKNAKNIFASVLSTYCVEEDYFPGYIVDLAERNNEVRRFLIYKLCKADKTDKALAIIENWPGRLDFVDNNNLGGTLTVEKESDLSIYFLRLAWFTIPNEVKNLQHLCMYYVRQNRMYASFYYYLYLPEEKDKEEVGSFEPPRYLNLPQSVEEAIEYIRPKAAREVYDNGMVRMNGGCNPAAILEFQAALQLGMDSLKVYDKLSRISASRREWEKAEQFFRLCVRLSAGNWQYLYNLGLVLAQKGKKTEAAELADRLAAAGVNGGYVERLRGVIGRE